MVGKFKELERKGVEEELQSDIHRPLLILSAPSGYGKTTLMHSFLDKNPDLLQIWLSLGHTVMDETLVWKKFCDCLSEVNVQVSERMRELGLPGNQQEIESFFAVIKRVTVRPVCFILDDYHACHGPAANRLIEKLAYENIPNLHMVLLTRALPDLSYEELFLKGYCAVYDQKSLALNKEESEEIFEMHGIRLSNQEKEKLHEYTDGWIAAVYLMLFDFMRNGHFESFASIGNLMETCLYDKVSDDMKEMCMKMSLFESFTFAEACYVLDKPLSEAEITQTRETFGFMQYDMATGTYTMHALLKNVALGELEKSGVDKKEIYLRCGQYRENEGNFISAFICYAKGEEYERALWLLSAEQKYPIYEQAVETVGEILLAIPLELRMKDPRAYLGYIQYILMKEDAVRGQSLLLEIKEKFEQTQGWEASERNRIKGELLIIETLLDFNYLEKINAKLREAATLLGEGPSDVFGNMLFTYGVPVMTVLYYNEPGSLFKVKELEKIYAGYYMQLTNKIDRGWDYFFDAEYYFLRGEFDRAEALSEKVLERTIQKDGLCVDLGACYIQLRCLIAQGEVEEVEKGMKFLAERMENVTRPLLVTEYELICGYIYACIGQTERIPVWLRHFELDNCGQVVRNVRSGCVIYGTMLCYRKEWQKLDAVAEQILVPYGTTRHMYIEIFGHLFKAIATLNLKGMEKACEHLLEAVELAKKDWLLTPFIERGGELLPMLEYLCRNNKFCRELLTPVREYQRGLKHFRHAKLKNGLTVREQEIMQMVKEGFRNQEISQKMNLALVTVEKNLTSIYRKLHVSNRTAAISKILEMEE